MTGGSGYLWGSYTNGAGLYSRSALKEVGRMFGEPGDGFHDAYVEANYAYRAALKVGSLDRGVLAKPAELNYSTLNERT